MSRRAAVLVLAAVIAVAIAIPALADSGTTAKTASVKGLSVRALGKAKAALRTARAAKRSATRVAHEVGAANVSAQGAKDAAAAASASATAAQGAANAAKGEAAQASSAASSASMKAGEAELKSKETRAELAATRTQIGFEESVVSTESTEFKPLGGPSVTVEVPQNGLIQVWGGALIEGPGAVSLYEGDSPLEGQAVECNGAKDVLFSAEPLSGEAELVGTPAAPSVTGACGSFGAPGPVLFRTGAGKHTFEFRYAACTCGGPPEKATFSQRRLVIAPLP